MPMKAAFSNIIKEIVLPMENAFCFNNTTESIGYAAMYMKLYEAASQAKTNAIDNNLIVEPLLNSSYYVSNAAAPRSLLMAHRDLVRSLFRFQDKIVQQAIDNINEALTPFNGTYHGRNFSIVTVHVRRTDYTGYIKGKFNLTQLDELYFTRAFKFYKTR